MSGENSEPEKKEEPVVTDVPKTVKKDELSVIKAQMKELAKEKEALQQALEQKDKKQLEEQNNWKVLYERTSEKLSQESKKAQEDRNAFHNTLKYSSVESQALKAGIDPDYLDLLSAKGLDGVDVDYSSDGTLTVRGAKEFVDTFKNQRPKLFKAVGAPNINNGRPTQGGDKKYTVQEALKLEKSDPAKYNEVMKNWSKYKA